MGVMTDLILAAAASQVSIAREGPKLVVRSFFDEPTNTASYVAHDPTTLNRQMPDSGTSYRSAIFPQSPAQRAVAAAYIAQLSQAHAFKAPIVTKLETGGFYPAEAYHQHFFDRNPNHPYITHWDKPKVAAFRAGFPSLAA